jgi:hypothetical protein
MSLEDWRSNAVFAKVDSKGDARLVPEAISALQPSNKSVVQVTAQTVAIETQATMLLPSVQAFTFTRGGINTAMTSNMMIVNTGDIITLGSSQLIKFVPL